MSVLPMAVADDQRLVELSSEPPGELFSILKRPNAFRPLLLLLAFLPGLYALEYRSLDTGGALWGLRSLKVYTATDTAEFIDPGGVTEASRLQWRSPLGSWVTAALMWLWSPSEPLTMVLDSYFATAGIVAMGYVFGDWLAGPRCGFWTTLLLAFQGTLLAQAQTPAPHSLAILLALVALWQHSKHLEDAGDVISRRLLFSGIALGLCLLASGTVALATAAVLLVYTLGLRGERVLPRRGPSREPRRVWAGWKALQSLAVLLLFAVVIGGWWPAYMATRYGTAFWSGWLMVRPEAARMAVAGLPAGLASSGLQTLGPMIGLCLLGLWITVRDAMANGQEPQRRRSVLLVVWVLVGGLMWIRLELADHVPDLILLLWRGFLLVPCVLLAAVAVESIAQRNVSVPITIAVACFTAAVLLWSSLAVVFERVERSTAVWLAVISALSVLLAAGWLIHYCRGRDAQQRVVLGVLLIALFSGNAVSGLAAVQQAGDDDRALAEFREELAAVQNVGSWMIVSDPPVSLQLRLVLRSLWPHASRRMVENWDAAFAQALTDPPAVDRRTIAVDWSTRDTRPTRIQISDLEVEAVTRPRFYQDKQLTAYELRLHVESDAD